MCGEGQWKSKAIIDKMDTTRARLTFLNATEFLVEADTDGDGAYDYNSDPQLW